MLLMLGRYGDEVRADVGGAQRLRLESFSRGQASLVSGRLVLEGNRTTGCYGVKWIMGSGISSHSLLCPHPIMILCGRVTRF